MTTGLLAAPDVLVPWASGVLRDALSRSPLLDGRPYEIFGQGSRVNGTAIEPASDIDLVLMLTAPGRWEDFRDDVRSLLGESFDVRTGRRCLNIDSLYGEAVDVLVATEHHGPEQGVFFRDAEGRPIVNFPKRHTVNGDAKDGRTGGWFKDVIRAAKRARPAGDPMPSYLIECLLFNVPDRVYREPDPYGAAFGWLRRCYRDHPAAFAGLPCQNGINRLFGVGPDQWKPGEAARIIEVLHRI
ncbi:hypothetical protein [Actinoplanes sp. NPDC051851]|uniref:hypothetical protein n=1 Tax=Actinoplanes sp. NPDC051851 TaxID=3154753 RepID=UPI0034469CF7